MQVVWGRSSAAKGGLQLPSGVVARSGALDATAGSPVRGCRARPARSPSTDCGRPPRRRERSEEAPHRAAGSSVPRSARGMRGADVALAALEVFAGLRLGKAEQALHADGWITIDHARKDRMPLATLQGGLECNGRLANAAALPIASSTWARVRTRSPQLPRRSNLATDRPGFDAPAALPGDALAAAAPGACRSRANAWWRRALRWRLCVLRCQAFALRRLTRGAAFGEDEDAAPPPLRLQGGYSFGPRLLGAPQTESTTIWSSWTA